MRRVNAAVGVSICVVLLASGAILYWAVTGDIRGVPLDVVGFVLVGLGAVGLLCLWVASAAVPRGSHAASWRPRIVRRAQNQN